MSYAIGVAQPTSISINTFGTGKVSDEKIIQLVRECFDLRPYAITTMLDLLHPMYQETAAYGHFGRTPSRRLSATTPSPPSPGSVPTAPSRCVTLLACRVFLQRWTKPLPSDRQGLL